MPMAITVASLAAGRMVLDVKNERSQQSILCRGGLHRITGGLYYI